MDIDIPVWIILDDDGLLRRECPHCNQEFKVDPGEETDESQDLYYCPLCGLPSSSNEQLTRDQTAHIEDVVMNAARGLINNSLEKLSRKIRNQPYVNVDNQPLKNVEPQIQVEALDMKKITLDCCSQQISVMSPLTYKVIYCYKCGSINWPK